MKNPILEMAEQIFRAGYDAGWEASGEGHNNEYSQVSAAIWKRGVDLAWEEFSANAFRTNRPTQGQQGI